MPKGARRAAETSAGRESEVRDRIFNSALRLFSQRGFAPTSLREIAEEAQTTKPMVYYYFGSKEGLYSSIVRQIMEEMAVAVRGEAPSDSCAAEQALAFCQRYIDHFLAREDTIALVLREVFGLGGVPMATFGSVLGERVLRPLGEIVAAGMERGEFASGNPGDSTVAITGILNMFILDHVFGGQPIDRDTPLQQAATFVRGLTARP